MKYHPGEVNRIDSLGSTGPVSPNPKTPLHEVVRNELGACFEIMNDFNQPLMIFHNSLDVFGAPSNPPEVSRAEKPDDPTTVLGLLSELKFRLRNHRDALNALVSRGSL